MSLKMIKPIDITDSIMTSSIAEPDLSVGEVEWEDRSQHYSYGLVPNENYRAIVELDGFLYMAGGQRIYKFDIANNSYTTIIDHDEFIYCAVYASDGFIYFGCSDNEILKINPSTDAVTVLTLTTTSTVNFRSITESPNGNLYLGALTGGIVRVSIEDNSDYEELTQELTTVKLASAVSTEGENLYFGGDDGVILKLNTSSSTASLITTSGTANISSGVLNDNGLIYFFSEYGPVYKVIDSTEEASAGAVAPFRVDTATNAGDGSIKLMGRSDKLYSYDVDSDSISSTEVSGTPFLSVYSASCLSDDGYVYAIGEGTSVMRLDPKYAADEQVILVSTHKLYQAATSTYDSPEVGVLAVPPTWVEVSATNKYRAFDYVINTKSTSASTIGVYTFTPLEPVTNICFFGLENITRVYIQVREDDENGALIYNNSKFMTMTSPIEDQVVNSDFLNDKVIFDDLPTYETPYITVTFNKVADSKVLIGDIVIGNSRTMGVTLYQSSTTRTSYDTVETDTFGNDTIVSRPSSEYTSFELTVYPEYADYVERILKDSLNKPRVWMATKPDGENLFTFGYYERSPITYSSPSKYDTTLKVRGLV